MNRDDAFCITMCAMIEAMADAIQQRSVPKSRRWNQSTALKERVQHVNDCIPGEFPQEFIKFSEKFFITVEASMNTLLKSLKG